MARAYKRTTSQDMLGRNPLEPEAHLQDLDGSHDSFHAKLAHTTTRFSHKRFKLASVCDVIKTGMLKDEKTQREINEHLSADLKDVWVAKLLDMERQLEQQKVPVVITGPKSVGKTSLLNLLLGDSLLPVGGGSKHHTGLVTCVDHCRRGRVRLLRHGKTVHEADLDRKVDASALACISEWRDEDWSTCAEISTYLAFLGDNVALVDTPGIEAKEIAKDFLKHHIENGAGVIVVLTEETVHCQSVRGFLRFLLDVTTRQNMKYLGTAQQETANVLFVVNGWEQKSAAQKKKVMQTLGGDWPDAEEDENIFFLSVKEALATLQSKSAPSGLVNFRNAFCDLVARCLHGQLLSAYEWLERLGCSFMDITRSKYNFAKLAVSRKAEEESLLREQLNRVRLMSQRRLSELDDLIGQICHCIRIEIMNHLRAEAALKRMSNFQDGDALFDGDEDALGDDGEPNRLLPADKDFEKIGASLLLVFLQRIDREINFWNEQHAVAEAEEAGVKTLDPTRTRFGVAHAQIRGLSLSILTEIEAEAASLNDLLQNESVRLASKAVAGEVVRGKSKFVLSLERAFDGLKPVSFVKLVLRGDEALPPRKADPLGNLSNRVTSLSTPEKVVFGATAVLWLPLALLGSALTLPIMAAIVARDRATNRKKAAHYMANQRQVAARWLRNFVRQTFDVSLLDQLIRDALVTHIHQIQEAARAHIDDLLQRISDRLSDLANDKRSLRCIRRIYDPVLTKVECILNAVYACHARYLRDYEFDTSDFKELRDVAVNVGNFGDIFRSFCQKTQRTMAVKIIKKTIGDQNALDIYTEEAAWRKLSGGSENILQLHGVIFMEKERRFGFVMELCDGTLKELTEESDTFVPGRHTARTKKLAAHRRMLELAVQLTAGLLFVHVNNYLHRDLKLENVLYQRIGTRVVVKLCDFGLSKQHMDVTTTIAGTILYMAPEVLSKHGCSQASDIYSLGLMLWEMYHGSQAYERCTEQLCSIIEVERAICRGELELDYPDRSLPDAFKQLIESCVAFDAAARPPVDEVHSTLRGFLAQLDASSS